MKHFLKIFWMPVVLYIFNTTHYADYLYITIPWFDHVMHALGGIAIALMFTTFQSHYKFIWWKNIPSLWKILFIICFVMLFGVAWEWYEFIHDQLYGTHYQPSLTDTMYDFLYDFIGSVIFCIIAKLLPSRRA